MNEPKARESESSIPGHLTALIRHFIDLRDGTHGGSAGRPDKETHFAHAVELLAPVARQALNEINTHLLLDTGKVVATGLQRDADGGVSASWDLVWPETEEGWAVPGDAPCILRDRLYPSTPTRRDRARLAAERLHRPRRRRPIADHARHCNQ